LFLVGRHRHALREHADHTRFLLGALVPAHDIVIEHRFDIPSLLLRDLREVLAAVQALLFSRHCEEDDGGPETSACSGSARTPGSPPCRCHHRSHPERLLDVEGIAVARVVMSGDQHNPLGILRIGPFNTA